MAGRRISKKELMKEMQRQKKMPMIQERMVDEGMSKSSWLLTTARTSE